MGETSPKILYLAGLAVGVVGTVLVLEDAAVPLGLLLVALGATGMSIAVIAWGVEAGTRVLRRRLAIIETLVRDDTSDVAPVGPTMSVARLLRQGPATFEEIRAQTGLDDDEIGAQLDRLLDDGRVDVDNGRWHVT